jgi:predicted deacylase
MTRRIERYPLQDSTPGTRREVLARRYGKPGARPKAYIQASIHADEIPALLAAHHLAALLDAADERGEIAGEVILVPYANPIGLGQFVENHHHGRREMSGGGNFNRNWPNLLEMMGERLDGKLTDSPAENVEIVRAELRAVLHEEAPHSEFHSLRLILARLAVDADLVFDLHCDDQALMHLFLIPDHWPLAHDIAAELGCRAVLLAEDSGGGSFDETFSTVWTHLAAKYPGHPIPAACLSGTVELRGQSDVEDSLAKDDAAALFRALQRHGAISGDPGPLPEPQCEATRLDACEILRAPKPGVVAYAVALGAQVREGDIVAWIVDPAAEEPSQAREPVRASTDGLILSRRDRRYVLPGMTLAKVVGHKTLPARVGGPLLED